MSRNFKIQLATPEYNEAICELFAFPMKGLISLSKERTPDFFAGAKIQNNFPESYIYINEDNNELAAVVSIGRREVYMESNKVKLQYLSDMRIRPKYRGGLLSFIVLKDILGSGKLDVLAQTAVLADNVTMLNSIEKLNRFCKKRGLPYYNYIGKIVTCLLPLPRRPKPSNIHSSLNIRWATAAETQAVQDFVDTEAPKKNFYPHYNLGQLNQHPYYANLNIQNYLLAFENGEIVGVTGVWDQDEIWRTKVVAYDRKLKLVKPFLNFYNHFAGGLRLPKEGSKLLNLYLHSILIKNDDPSVFEQLLKYMLYSIGGDKYDQLVLGLSEFDNCLTALNRFRNKRLLYGNYYLVTEDEALVKRYEGENFYMEVARI